MRIGKQTRRAVVTLFLVGWSRLELGRLFRLRLADVDQVLRQGLRRA